MKNQKLLEILEMALDLFQSMQRRANEPLSANKFFEKTIPFVRLMLYNRASNKSELWKGLMPMDALGKPVSMKSLEMAKKRNKKVYITDIAINKVPFIQYKGFTDNQNHIMRELAQEVLMLSKDENDSNEVAITCDLGVDNPLEVYGVSFGTEHEVDVRADTLSNHILVSQKSVAVVVLHNHPSIQTFSIQDIRFFIEFSVLEVMVVVSDQGTVHYLRREESYDLKKAISLFNECVEGLKKDSPLTEVYLAALSFLAKSSEVGVYYR